MTVSHHRAGLVALALSMGLFSAACGGGEEPVETQEQECFSNKEYFNKKLWKPILEQKCFTCHNQSGQAKYTSLVFQPTAQTGHIEANLASLTTAARYQVDGESIILQKPVGKLEHEGGALLQEDTEEYQAIVEMLTRLDNPVECAEKEGVDEHFTPMTETPSPEAKVVLLDPQLTVRRATLNLGGRLPTADELKLVEEQGLDAALPSIVENLAGEDVFYERVGEMFNDMFLTDKYLGRNNAIDLLDGDVFPDSRWHIDSQDNPKDYSGVDPAFLEAAREYTNNSVAREPLELIKYLVRNDKPMTEMITADYMLVNPFTAKVYGVRDASFSDPNDPNQWRPGHIEGYPHAGVLSSPMFLNRFPTTATNRNRHRSRMVYKFFLATDVMALAERPLDPTSIVDFNPTLYNPQCTSCHAVIDPVAGAFQNWDARGMYAPPEEGWFQEMLPPGFGEAVVPGMENSSSLSWMAKKMAADPRFATAMTYNVYKGLTGHEPINPLSDDPEVYENLLVGFEIQQQFFDATATNFIASDYNFKTLLVDLIKSPYFRTTNLAPDMDTGARYQYDGIGTGRMLTPEMLHRKIEAIMGTPWADRPENGTNYLLSTRNYRILYGGIDSNDVTQRITAPNGIMANVQWRMANEMSCRSVARDFALPTDQRRLFTKIEPSFQPTDDNGFQVDGAVQAIKENIQHLHAHILGERLALDDPELEETYKLFYETWRETKLAVRDEELSQDVPYACRGESDWLTGEEFPEDNRIRRDREGTIRAWMAVVTYLLSDYRFLHE